MKLEKYEDKRKKNRKLILISISVIVLISVSLLLYKTFASFTESAEFPIMNGKVDYFGNSDIYFVFYKNNELTEEMPTKDNKENLVFEHGECDNGASIEWNYEEWSPLVKNLKSLKTKCSLYFEERYTEKILRGTDPVLGNKLIPIVINEENGKVTRANEKEKWYDYEAQKWANAVILRDGKSDPGANQPIAESDIESYFVWIPRYRYQIFDEGNYDGLTAKTNKEQIINVEFENKNVKPQNGSKEGEWLTHPAFTSFNTNGIWVGKFETGYDGAENTNEARVNPVDEASSIEETKKVIIKPNVYSWRDIQVAKAYVIGRHYKATLNSHMMKNTEWGAVAYLQHSEYGSHESVRINNNSDFLTGYAAKQEPTTGYTGSNELCRNTPEACNEYGGSEKGKDGEYNTEYFNKASVVASTTNNYTGIYDMSGGAWDYVMAGIDDNSTGDGKTGKLSSGKNYIHNSGFNGKLTCPDCNDDGVEENYGTEITNGIDLPTDTRYYDKYDNSLYCTTYNRGFLGDATKELGPFQNINYNNQIRPIGSWYNDEAWFIDLGAPWVLRGGDTNIGSGAGIFNFHFAAGVNSYSFAFRIVLSF